MSDAGIRKNTLKCAAGESSGGAVPLTSSLFVRNVDHNVKRIILKLRLKFHRYKLRSVVGSNRTRLNHIQVKVI